MKERATLAVLGMKEATGKLSNFRNRGSMEESPAKAKKRKSREKLKSRTESYPPNRTGMRSRLKQFGSRSLYCGVEKLT